MVDLTWAELFSDEIPWDMKLIIRQWEEFDTGLEFRLFVCQEKLVAITQYQYLIWIPEILHRMEDILHRIGSLYYEDLVARLPYKSQRTGPCLFSWNDERRILQGGMDVWEDLDEWESVHPPTSLLPPVPDVLDTTNWTFVESTSFTRTLWRVMHGHRVAFRILHRPAPNVTEGFLLKFPGLSLLEASPSPNDLDEETIEEGEEEEEEEEEDFHYLSEEAPQQCETPSPQHSRRCSVM